jgi:hypothetical protein
MTNRRHIEPGFGTVEVLIVIAAVIALSGAGWLVYQHHHTSKTVSNSTPSTTQTNKQPVSDNTQTTQTATQYMDITQWGVRAPYSGSLKLSYGLDGQTAAFSSDQLTALSSDCVGRGGFIMRWASTDKVTNGIPADANTPTAATYFASADPSSVTYAHVGNYYYMFQHDMAACGDPNSTASLQSQTNDAVKALVSDLQPSPK